MKKKLRYSIILFCNNQKIKECHSAIKRTTIHDKWEELKTEKKPPYTIEYGGKRGQKQIFELALIYPNNRWAKQLVYKRDQLGRTTEVKLDDDTYRIKHIIPYWKEELIYDHDAKKRIRYHELMNHLSTITEISQIFMLNNKIFLQIENEIKMYGNKNLSDSERLFEIIRTDLLKQKKGNFIFVKDIATTQRKLLYEMLEKKGYKRTELFRHYSY